MSVAEEAIASFFLILCTTITFKTPFKYVLPSTLLGFLSFIGIKVFSQFHVLYATLFTAFFVASISHLLARITKRPAQIFLIPGIIFLLQGVSLYRAFSSALSNDSPNMFHFLTKALAEAVGVSFGVLMANWFVPSKKIL